MATGSAQLPELHPVAGVRLAHASAGIRKAGRRDLALLALVEGSSVAAVFTTNAFCAAPVIVAREHLQAHSPRALLINTGSANAGTGAAGLEAARRSCQALAQTLGVAAEEVLPFSTGVIGEQLAVARIEAALPGLVSGLDENGWAGAAEAILTTDTRAKGATARVEVNGRDIAVTGISKGAGMIRPDMATMLAFVATDAPVSQAHLQALLSEVTQRSFNRISVDGDTSTNDACVLVATGAAGGDALTPGGPGWDAFTAAVETVCVSLAQAIVRDGEGATKFITLDVTGAASEAEARGVAEAVAHSPLVKTAFYAGDPNWGRILAAVGRAGIADLDITGVDISLGEVALVRGGEPAPGYTETAGQAVMAEEDITVRIHMGRGEHATQIWTCDLGHDYVRINAEYRT